MLETKVEQFLANITQLAATQADILALALVGSHARDADLVLISVDPKR
jgi:hypothetical protein